jgi:hypothetical protein
MIPNLDEWVKISSAVYYTGVGAVLMGTSIRFGYRFIAKIKKDAATVHDLRDVDVKAHLGNIYIALQHIANELDIKLQLNSPNLQLEDSWILSDLPPRKK